MKATLLAALLFVGPALAADFPTDPKKLDWKCHQKAAEAPLVLQYKKTRTEDNGSVTVLYGESCVCKDCENIVDAQVFEWGYGIKVLDAAASAKKHQIEFFYGPGVNKSKQTPAGFHRARALVAKEEWFEFSPAPFTDSQSKLQFSDKIEARIHRR